MITFLCGTAGSGKSTAVAQSILSDLRNGIPVLLLVPEQMAIVSERRITELAESASDPIATDRLEILNFTRLADRVFRTEGGICYQSIGNGGRTLIMYRTLAQCEPYLTEYRSALVSPESAARMMLAAVQELQIYSVTPSRLVQSADLLSSESPLLCRKLRDLALISQTYHTILTECYDDPLDELPRLAAILEKRNLFGDYHIYFDSFNGLTPQEYRVVECLFRQAKNITFTILTDPLDRGLEVFASVDRMHRRLERLAKNYRNVILQNSVRFVSPVLNAICRHLFDSVGAAEAACPPCGNALRVFACNNTYAQAEQIAIDIRRRIRTENCRYRDIAIICADAGHYRGIIDAYLNRYHIPFFLSERQDMTQLPMVKLIMTLLSLKQHRYRTEDVTELMKTGLTPLNDKECDLLEAYADTWSIRGDRWVDEDEWTMHPRGYLREMREDDIRVLTQANALRHILMEPIKTFLNVFDGPCTVIRVTEELYRFLISFGVVEKLKLQEGDRAGLIWNTVMDALDELVTVCANDGTSAEHYSRLFTMLIREIDIGRLPATVDEVVVGSASLLRAENIKHVYLLGVNDDEFPAAATEGSIFSDDDKVMLEGVGVELSSSSLSKGDEALLHFWRACCSASHTLTLLYARASLQGENRKPAFVITRLLALFPDLTVMDASALPTPDLLESPDADFARLSSLSDSPIGEALRRYYESNEAFAPRLRILDSTLCQSEPPLSQETIAELYPSNLLLSQTRLEDYVGCAFAYHCKHVLRLSSSKKALIRPTDTGSFVHHILDVFFRTVTTKEGVRCDMTEEETEHLTEQIILTYLSDIFGGRNRVDMQSGRLMALFRRLRRSVLVVIREMLEEFSHSAFVPAAFELPIGFSSDDDAIAPLAIPLSDGTKAYLVGRIDRVDTYKRGKDVYLRVVDYKTGIKTFSVKDLEIGLNMQMLLYLFSVWKHNSKAISERFGVEEGGELLPAGVLYCTAMPKCHSFDHMPDREQVRDELRQDMKRSGMLLYDEEILKAMDSSEGMRYLPVRFNKDGSISSYTIQSQTLQTLEQFGALMRQVTELVSRIGGEIKSGVCDLLPIKDPSAKIDACRYCEMRPVCRNFKRSSKPKYRKEGEIDHG